MRKLLFLIPLLFTIMCEPVDNAPVPGSDPASTDSVSPVNVTVAPIGVTVEPSLEPEPAPVVLEDGPGFCQPGTACDIAGDRLLSRNIDVYHSTFTEDPDDKGFSPGDKVTFELCARTAANDPVAGVPGIVVLRARKDQIAGDGTTLTGMNGCVKLPYTVQDKDMIGDPDNGVADSGSYFLDAYLAGRRINKNVVLHDTQ